MSLVPSSSCLEHEFNYLTQHESKTQDPKTKRITVLETFPVNTNPSEIPFADPFQQR